MNPLMIKRARFAALVLAAASLAGCGSYSMMPTMQAAPARVSGGALVGSNGMTLYTFDRDMAGSGKSVCNGPCATNWPPLMADEGARASGNWSVVTRDDGKKQWAYKGKPMYFWIKDTKPGDKTGDGVNQVWHTATP